MQPPRLPDYFKKLIRTFAAFSLGLICAVDLRPASPELQSLAENWDFNDLNFEAINLFENHSAGRIQAIAQDENGLIWIGSQQGLFRFDGRRVLSFVRDPHNPRSLPNNSITALHMDSQGRLWLGTQRGIALYLPEKEEFQRELGPDKTGDSAISSQVNGIVHTSDGTVYASTEAGRIFKLDEPSATFVPVSEQNFGTIKSLAVDPQDRLWIGANGKLSQLAPDTGEAQTFEASIASDDNVSINYVNSICYVDETEVWLGTSLKGLLIINPLDASVESLPIASQPDSYVNQVSIDATGRIWSATNAGLDIIDSHSKRAYITADKDAETIKTPPSGINTLYVDHQGTVWIGSNYDGVSKVTNRKKFETVPLHERNPDLPPNAPASAFLEDSKGNLWVGDPKSGLAMYPPGGDEILRITHDPEDPNSLTNQPILSLLEDSKGTIWIGTYRGGLYSYHPKTRQLRSFRSDPNDPYSIGGHDIRAAVEAQDGTLWFATHGNGVSHFDPESGRFTNYTEENSEQTGFFVPNNWINTILIDKQQNIWLSSRSGATRIDPTRKSYKQFTSSGEQDGSLSNSETTDLFEDSKGRIWIATKDGLNLYLPQTETFKSYSVADGLPDRFISSIIEDEEGNLWLGTLGGLARFDPESESVQSYDSSDGLVSDDFFETSVARSVDGILYFGQNKGLTRFDPKQIVDDKTRPAVFITGLRIAGHPLEISEDGPLTKSFLRTSKLNLRHDQNALIFEFVAIDFKKPSKNRYRYKLEGFDKQWTDAGTRADAVYTNLPSGNFVFRVQASNVDGYWNESGDSLAIQITPPLWDTIPFRILLVAILVSVPVGIFFLRIRTMRSEARRLEIAVQERTKDLKQANEWLEEANAKTQSHGELLERTVKDRTKELEIAKEKAEHSDKLKSAFLANMSHEIRTPMNAIIGFLHMLENTDIEESERKQYFDIIQQSSKSLLALIDDILDLSAIEAGEADISLQLCSVDDICKELGALFRETLSSQKRGNVRFAFERNLPNGFDPDGPLNMMIDPLRLKQILWNLLSNALKFTEAGEIRLAVTVAEPDSNGESSILFSVKDSGIGIPAEEHKRIFNRFHKLDDLGKKLYRGTGLGLTITHTLTKLMSGSIRLESEPGVGTEFFVSFPFSLETQAQDSDSKSASIDAAFLETDLSNFRLLLVEDEIPNYEYIKLVLANTGIRIKWLNKGGQVLSEFKNQHYDIVLLDLKLPEVDGYELAAQLRELSPEIPIIVQSAYAMREDQARSAAAGANEHLSKPFSPPQLISILAKYLLSADSSPTA